VLAEARFFGLVVGRGEEGLARGGVEGVAVERKIKLISSIQFKVEKVKAGRTRE
jgi:hypothetical protein